MNKIKEIVSDKVLELSEKTSIEEKKIYDFLRFLGFRRMDSKSVSTFLIGLNEFTNVSIKFSINNFMRNKEKYKSNIKNQKVKTFLRYLVSNNYEDDLNEDLNDEIIKIAPAYNEDIEELESQDFDYQLRKLEDELD